MKRMSKITAIILTLVLVMSMVMVFSAAENDTTPSLGMANVAYEEKLTLVFTVENVADGETAGIAVYESEDAEDGNTLYTTFTAKEDEGVTYYETFGIDAKDIETVYYVAAISRDAEGNVTYGEKVPYSIATYIAERIGAEPTEAQTNLYNKVLAYGAAAKAVLGE